MSASVFLFLEVLLTSSQSDVYCIKNKTFEERRAEDCESRHSCLSKSKRSRTTSFAEVAHLSSFLTLLPTPCHVTAAQPSNDRCVNARPLIANEPVDGDVSNANFDFNAQGVCGARSDRSALWYRITGTGREITVQLCTNNDKVTDFGVFLACNSQLCKGFPPVNTGEIFDCAQNKTLDYTFAAQEDTFYYVHVRSDIESVDNPNGSQFTVGYLEDEDDPIIAPKDDISSVKGISAVFAVGLSALIGLF
eukprot:scaffold982_cov139-Cylindrotheca_fusiformis.AAC.14